MSNHYLFTGFPGFICNQLMREILKQDKQCKLYALVLPNMMEKAKHERNLIRRECELDVEDFILIEGDITKPLLMIDKDISKNLTDKVTHVFHLAAIYDLAVQKEIAYKVNVTGTDHVNKWVQQLNQLKRYVYFSTAYVAGRREGTLLETELIRPSSFKNFYEETKFEAEVLVEELKGKVPLTIIRPGIVKGHSKTGETCKFDGPYFILNFLDKLKRLPILPSLGEGRGYVNLVPIDYIVQATVYLSLQEIGIGKTYHLTDPSPYRAFELYDMFMKEMLNKKPIGRIPLTIAKGSLSLKPVRKYLRVEKEALDYFLWRGEFDCKQAQSDLLLSGIKCPNLKEGLKEMVEFYLQNKDQTQYHVSIL